MSDSSDSERAKRTHSEISAGSEDEDEAPKLKAARMIPTWLDAFQNIDADMLGPYGGFGAPGNGVTGATIGYKNDKAASGWSPHFFDAPPGFVTNNLDKTGPSISGLGTSKTGDLSDPKLTKRKITLAYGAGLIPDELHEKSPNLRDEHRAFIAEVKAMRARIFNFLFERESKDETIKRAIADARSLAEEMATMSLADKKAWIRNRAFTTWLNTGMTEERHLGWIRGEGENETMCIEIEMYSQFKKDAKVVLKPRQQVDNPTHQAFLDLVGPWGPNNESNVPEYFGPGGVPLINPETKKTFNEEQKISETNWPRGEVFKIGDLVQVMFGLRLSLSSKGKSLKPIGKSIFTLHRRHPGMAERVTFSNASTDDYGFTDPFA